PELLGPASMLLLALRQLGLAGRMRPRRRPVALLELPELRLLRGQAVAIGGELPSVGREARLRVGEPRLRAVELLLHRLEQPLARVQLRLARPDRRLALGERRLLLRLRPRHGGELVALAVELQPLLAQRALPARLVAGSCVQRLGLPPLRALLL